MTDSEPLFSIWYLSSRKISKVRQNLGSQMRHSEPDGARKPRRGDRCPLGHRDHPSHTPERARNASSGDTMGQRLGRAIPLITPRPTLPRPITHRRWICVVGPDEAKQLAPGINYQCNGSSKHPHYTANRVKRLVQDGAMAWVGAHNRVAVYRQARNWRKVYRRNAAGEVIWCGMQWVRGG